MFGFLEVPPKQGGKTMHTPLNIKQNNTKILLICDKAPSAEKIKNCLKQSMRVSWSIMHCVTVKEAMPRMHGADIIILDLALEGPTMPKEIFREVQHLSLDTPVIVLTGRKKHNLCTYVMEKGAADTIVRGGFGRLVDAIEFALIRQKIKKVTSDQNANDQKDRQDARDIEATKAKKISDEKDQCIAWLSGGYSVQSTAEKDAA